MTQEPGPSPAAAPSLRSKIGRVAAASAVALALAQVVSLGQTIALARLLSPSEVGLFVAGSVLTSFVGDFVEGGLRSTLVHREHDLDDTAETIFWATLLSGVAMALVSLAAAPVIGLLFDSRTAGLVAASMSGTVLLQSLTNVPEAWLQREFSVRRRLVVGPAISLSFACVSVTLAFAGFGVWSMVLGSYASFCVWVVCLWLICPWRPGRGRATVRLWRELAGFGLPLALGSLGDRARQGVQAVVTGTALGTSGVGLQRYGERIARIPATAMVEISSISLFPAFSRMSRAAGRLEVGYLRALNVVTTGAAPVSAMMLAVGEPLVVVLLGEKWRGAGVALVAMAGLGLGKAFQTVSEEAIKGAGRTKLLNWQTASELALSVILLLALIRPLGLVGVGLSISLTALIVGGVVVVLALQVVGVSFRQIINAAGPPILCALVGLATVAPLEHLVFHSDRRGTWGGIGLLTVDGLVFLLVYCTSLALISPTAVRDLLRVIRRRKDRSGSGVPLALDVGPSLDATTGEPSTPDRTQKSRRARLDGVE